MTTSQQPSQPNSRLDREIDEILEQASRRPVSFQERVDQRRNAARQQRRSASTAVRPLGGKVKALAMRVPIITAVILAAIAAWLSSSVPLLAVVFALAAIAMVFAPFVQRRSESLSGQTRWRGRVESSLPPADSDTSGSWLDDLRRRLRR